jgi:thiamine-monophosphate kinase
MVAPERVVKVVSIAELGEKVIIEQYLRPLFNPEGDRNSLGDDCAAFSIPSGTLGLISTDRIPADLISFRAGILDYYGLGQYLAVLNLSDVAACGGVPLGMLLNLGLPSDFEVDDLLSFSKGVLATCEAVHARVLGGDMSVAAEISASATSLGFVESDKILRRSGARRGDSIFISRPVGLTPVALRYCLTPGLFSDLAERDVARLVQQFTGLSPMIELGRQLATSGCCSACMDNTDGIGQSLSELARESGAAFILDESDIILHEIVERSAMKMKCDPLTLALGPGADFSLVGTLSGRWSSGKARKRFGNGMQIVGTVQDGEGIFVRSGGHLVPLCVQGWNYFLKHG